jgi:muramoyltetrapeptide carboxypeptidase
MTPLLVPAALEPGDHVALVAPSGPFDRDAFERGVRLLSSRGYVCHYDEAIFARDGYLAGDDTRRERELLRALADPDIKVLIAARGGFGATRLLPCLSVSAVRAAGKGLVGFSDITALHALWARAGVASLHAAMVAKVGDLDEARQLRWLRALEGAPTPALTGLSAVVPGRVEGRLVGGNLAVLAALVGTPFAPPLEGSVLFLEDIGERPYRIDRMLTTLTHAGWFEQVRGVAFGAFSECAPGAEGVSGRDVLLRHAEALGLPCVLDVPAGHVDDNHELPLGHLVELDAAAGALRFV